jgi:putative flippase GtrA
MDRSYASPGEPRRADGLGTGLVAFRAVRFAVASVIGFLIAEAIIALGVVALYHTSTVPAVSDSSTIIGLDALALGTGVTAAFVVNELVTVGGAGQGRRKGRASWLVRLCKYQLASLLGNVIVVGVQLVLLETISLSPVFGSIVGAVVSYPLTYAVSMLFVWGVRPFR